ncbi:hypothetical protein EDB87DRAFT_888405 [Lactarius vividus]|nr:hypothetical protein EDB87DRAFT_888405 [Lactarius vividus]
MDNFINLAKKGYEAYEKSQSNDDDNSNYRKTGGEEYNSPHHSQQGSSHGGPQFRTVDHDEVVRTAKTHGSGDDSLFSSALSYVHDNKGQHHDDIDEHEVQEAHRKVYEDNSDKDLPASSLGSAAALEVLKKFASGNGGKSGSGNSQTQLISMAMAEASKLFDKSGGGSSGKKQDAVNGAAMTVVKLLVKSKFSGGVTGGADSGGLGSLLHLVRVDGSTPVRRVNTED